MVRPVVVLRMFYVYDTVTFLAASQRHIPVPLLVVPSVTNNPIATPWPSHDRLEVRYDDTTRGTNQTSAILLLHTSTNLFVA